MPHSSALPASSNASIPPVYIAVPPSNPYKCCNKSSELFYRFPLTSASIIVSITYLALDYAISRLIMSCDGVKLVKLNKLDEELDKELFDCCSLMMSCNGLDKDDPDILDEELFLFELFTYKYKYEVVMGLFMFGVVCEL